MTPTTTTSGRFFLLAHKGFVELRKAKRPPKPIRKVLVKEISERRWCQVGVDEWGFLSYDYKDFLRTQKIPIVTFQGGKPLKSFKPRRITTLTGHTLSLGTVWEVNAEVATQLLQKS